MAEAVTCWRSSSRTIRRDRRLAQTVRSVHSGGASVRFVAGGVLAPHAGEDVRFAEQLIPERLAAVSLSFHFDDLEVGEATRPRSTALVHQRVRSRAAPGTYGLDGEASPGSSHPRRLRYVHQGSGAPVLAVPARQVADPTGGGDAFRAGYLAGLGRGLSPERSAQVGGVGTG
ncbi:PfkB family carbohydrate kinase [Streptomyces sp. NPDC050509]|uniref:PfkB family carbohydrate kinase n=1 Tax=Streptomyces sp. NPDC050509 TaxID=3365620 RepID=UPI00379542A5